MDTIAKIYAVIDAKMYGHKGRAPQVDFSFINLTLFHRYEDVYQVGKKLPLFFSNHGPASAQLLKEPPTNQATNDQLLCGDPAVPKVDAACVDSFQSMFEFVTSRIGSRKVIPISATAGRWQLYTILDAPRTVAHQHLAGCHKINFLPYAVYSCHKVHNSIARVVPIVGRWYKNGWCICMSHGYEIMARRSHSFSSPRDEAWLCSLSFSCDRRHTVAKKLIRGWRRLG